MALREDGSIAAWGYNFYGQCDVPEPNTGFVQIESGNKHNLAIRADGSLEAWGYDNCGQCQVPQPNQDYLGVSAGMFHTLALKPDDSGITQTVSQQSPRAFPNPFTHSVTAVFAEWAGEPVTVHDLTGRVVAFPAAVPGVNGHISVKWNGTGFSGGRLSPGVYFIRATAPGPAVVRVVLI